ncbi:hypothetical protein A2U01_0100395, partial [Trifolium medium]|nr:hypothetical protein [Trifolium medium]
NQDIELKWLMSSPPPRTNCWEEPEFDSWWKQFLVKLYLPGLPGPPSPKNQRVNTSKRG